MCKLWLELANQKHFFPKIHLRVLTCIAPTENLLCSIKQTDHEQVELIK